MICSVCEADVALARFCSQCGSPLGKSSTDTTCEDITYKWIASIMESEGYEAVDLEEADKNGFFVAKSERAANWLVQLRKPVRFLCLTSPWNLNQPSMFQKGAFYKALSAANSTTMAVQVSIEGNNLETLNIQVPMFLGETVTAMDFVKFLDVAEKMISRILIQPAIKPFLA